jgi:hypothetical protein
MRIHDLIHYLVNLPLRMYKRIPVTATDNATTATIQRMSFIIKYIRK